MAPTFVAFRETLSDLLRRMGHVGTGNAAGDATSSHRVIKAQVQPRSLSDYHFEGYVDSDWYGPRKAGYLAAYVSTFGPRFSAAALRFDEGELLPDLAIMKTMLRHGCVTADGSDFVLTKKGRALVAPFVVLGDNEMEEA